MDLNFGDLQILWNLKFSMQGADPYQAQPSTFAMPTESYFRGPTGGALGLC